MDLSLPLRTLIPSLDSDVLAVLAGTESSLGATQIARLAARGSRQGVSAVLDRLTEHGLVLAHPTNRGYVYQLNRDHVLASVLLAGLQVRQQVVALLIEQIGALDPQPVYASVFGSFARADGSPSSDIDILLITPSGHDNHAERWVSQTRDLEDRILAATGNRLEPLVLTVDDFRLAVRTGEPIVTSLAQEAIGLTGTTFEDLLATVGRSR